MYVSASLQEAACICEGKAKSVMDLSGRDKDTLWEAIDKVTLLTVLATYMPCQATNCLCSLYIAGLTSSPCDSYRPEYCRMVMSEGV